MPFDSSVAMIGHSLGNFVELPFLSDRNLYEYATLIVDPGAIDAELEQFGGPPFRQNAHYWFTRRMKELDTWIDDGHTLILLVTAPKYWEFEFMEESGLPFSEQISFYEMPALTNLEFRRSTGNQVDYVGPANAASLFQPFLNQLSYQAITTSTGVQPLLQVRRRTPGERQLVGCLDFYNKGRIICVPFAAGTQSERAAYLEALAGLPSALTGEKPTLPAWVDSFRTNQELLSVEAIKQLNEEISQRQVLLAQQQRTIADFKELKSLFAASGEQFKNTVAAALQELGLNVVDGPHPRADLLATDGIRSMAIEAKGLDGNARETNFRQVERWKSEVNLALTLAAEERDTDPDLKRYAEQLQMLEISSGSDEACKGLMVIGTFRTTPLNNRNQPDFPEPVVRLLVQSNVCALTGLQLFGLLLMARSDPSLKDKIVSSLFGTAGVLDLATDWRQFLTEDGLPDQIRQ